MLSNLTLAIVKIVFLMKEKTFRKREGFSGQRLIVVPKKITTDFLIKDPLTRQLYLTDIGYYPKAKYHYVSRLSGISQHIIIYCVEGSGRVEIDKRSIEIPPSQFITIPANIPHKYFSNENDPWTIYWIHFKGDLSLYLVGLLQQHSKGNPQNITYNEKRINLFEEIYTNLERGYSGDNLRYLNMAFFHFLSSFLYAGNFDYIKNKLEKDIISASIDLMQQKIHTVLGLPELSNFASLSVSHFSSVFKTKTGYSPIEYFNHLKIQKACMYLLISKMSIKEIAINLGIDDQYYFSRMFSKLMGVSPTEYRKRNSTDQ